MNHELIEICWTDKFLVKGPMCLQAKRAENFCLPNEVVSRKFALHVAIMLDLNEEDQVKCELSTPCLSYPICQRPKPFV